MGAGEIFLAVISIIMINLVLSGDNAVVIGLAMRDLPQEMRKQVALAASLGAVILRVIFTVFAVYLLQIKFLSAFGGIVLIWITYCLIKSSGEEVTEVKGSKRFWRAIWLIIFADLSMAFDNVLGVAGAAKGHTSLVILGLAISIPMLIFGSAWLSSLMNRWPIIIYVAAMVLLHTAASMIVHDQGLHFIGFLSGHTLGKMVPWMLSLPVLIYGIFITKKHQMSRSES